MKRFNSVIVSSFNMNGDVITLNAGMSKDMYEFILENINKLNYDLENGLVITPKKTNGSICTSTGYLKAKVNKKTLQVHQILAVIYFGEKCIGMQVNHKDGNKLNNKEDNLEIVTQLENIRHAFKTGLNDDSVHRFIEMRKKQKGESMPSSKLTEDDVRYIRNSKESHASLSRKFKVDPKAIRSVRKFQTWKHVI